MRTLLVFAVFVLLVGCTAPDKTRETLEDLGFTNIEAGGYAPFACGDDYTFSTQFTATNPAGRRVSGVVCCGFLKGCTPKF